MSKNPAFLFYPNDFIAGTNLMTNEQVGKYIRLLCYQYGQGHLSEEDMIVVCGSYDKKIFSKFKQDEKGSYYNERLEEEISKRQKYCEAQSNNVKKRWENHNTTVDTTVLPPNIPSGNEIINEYIYSIDNDNLYNIEDVQTDVQNVQKDVQNAQFDEFWCAYPKKMNKERARCAFVRIKPSEQLFAQMLEALRKHKQSKQWQDAQYIPYPSTWLNGKRWEDELEEADEPSNSTFNTDEFFQAAVQRGRRQ